MRTVVLIAHNLRSCHNVGSLLRTAEGLAISRVYLTGYTPYPQKDDDKRLPHIAQKVNKQISKTALGAEKSQTWQQHSDFSVLRNELKEQGYTIAALEQTKTSLQLPDWKTPDRIALVVGREVEGIEPEIIKECDLAVEIPMYGQKESFNVVQAAAMALYHCRFN